MAGGFISDFSGAEGGAGYAEATRSCAFLSIEDLPIPEGVEADSTWPPILAELADHVGAYDALLICDAFAGRELYIPIDPQLSPLRGLISDSNCTLIAHVYGRERLPIPTGRNTILRAKRAGVISAIRSGELTVVRGAAILRMARRHLSRLVNQTNEGVGVQPTALPEPRVLVALRHAARIASDALRSLGASSALIAETSRKILDLWFRPMPPKKGNSDETYPE